MRTGIFETLSLMVRRESERRIADESPSWVEVERLVE